MTYIVAVSGGVDSVVLLHKLVKTNSNEIVVAHFDHGIRSDSAADARFVKGLAEAYDLPFVSRREELGKNASENYARERRYMFLHAVSNQYDGKIVTAHHADDAIETMAINVTRGTGWRGIAILRSDAIYRPLLDLTKNDLYTYALQQRLEWVEDSTNATDLYLRNRLRTKINLNMTSKAKKQLWDIRQQQLLLQREIDREVARQLRGKELTRYYMTNIDDLSAVELLRTIFLEKTGNGMLRPQLQHALLAIKTAKPGTVREIGNGCQLRFTAESFIVETP